MSTQALKVSAVSTAATDGSAPLSPTRKMGYKLPPVCQEATMKEVSMTAEELAELAFESTSSLEVITPSADAAKKQLPTSSSTNPHQGPHRIRQRHEVIPISSSSSTCTRESDTLSDAEGQQNQSQSFVGVAAATPAPTKERKDHLDRINAKVSQSKTSRQGRGSQRWITTSEHNASEAIRLVTGCVPILKGGKILLVSASRKPEWILPKGGWETDEDMEESAVREVFEEAGVLGVLGPKLTDFQYETRKSKKRRIEQAQILEKKLKMADDPRPDGAGDRLVSNSVLPSEPEIPSITRATSASSETSAAAPISMEDLTRIRSLSREVVPRYLDETTSCTSTHSSAYSCVRMTLFPLYVNQVLGSWPEEGRSRVAVDIDKAIEMLALRPEFKAALIEVKEKGLHLIA